MATSEGGGWVFRSLIVTGPKLETLQYDEIAWLMYTSCNLQTLQYDKIVLFLSTESSTSTDADADFPL